MQSVSLGESEVPYPKPSVAWYVVGVLVITWTCGVLDRMIVTLLTPSLKQDLLLSDTEISFVQGLGFSLFFVLAGLPLGRLVDRTNRRNVLIAGILTWSLMTFCCGLATNYWQLLVARAGVGIGEACLAPAAVSILADYLRPSQRGKATGVLSASSGLGVASSHLLVGLLLGAIGGSGMVWVPVLGEIASWRFVFIVFALPGIFIALLLTTIREPVRRERQSGATTSFLPYLKRNAGAFLTLNCSFALNGMVVMGLSLWEPAVFTRLHGMSPSEIGVTMGSIFLALSCIGGVVGGHISDVMFKRFPLDGRVRMLLLFGPVMALMAALVMVDSVIARLVAFGGVVACNHMMQASIYAGLQDMTPSRMRGQMIAVLAIIANLLGLGLGPTLIALATDYLFRDEAMVAYSIAVICVPGAVLSWLLAIWALNPVRRLRREFIAAEQEATGVETDGDSSRMRPFSVVAPALPANSLANGEA